MSFFDAGSTLRAQGEVPFIAGSTVSMMLGSRDLCAGRGACERILCRVRLLQSLSSLHWKSVGLVRSVLIGATRCGDNCENTVLLETQGHCGSVRKCSAGTRTDDTSAQTRNSWRHFRKIKKLKKNSSADGGEIRFNVFSLRDSLLLESTDGRTEYSLKKDKYLMSEELRTCGE